MRELGVGFPGMGARYLRERLLCFCQLKKGLLSVDPTPVKDVGDKAVERSAISRAAIDSALKDSNVPVAHQKESAKATAQQRFFASRGKRPFHRPR